MFIATAMTEQDSGVAAILRRDSEQVAMSGNVPFCSGTDCLPLWARKSTRQVLSAVSPPGADGLIKGIRKQVLESRIIIFQPLRSAREFPQVSPALPEGTHCR